jgi:hypothetical protein
VFHLRDDGRGLIGLEQKASALGDQVFGRGDQAGVANDQRKIAALKADRRRRRQVVARRQPPVLALGALKSKPQLNVTGTSRALDRSQSELLRPQGRTASRRRQAVQRTATWLRAPTLWATAISVLSGTLSGVAWSPTPLLNMTIFPTRKA